MQPPVTQSCSESALVSLGAPKAPALTRPQAVVLAVAAPRKVDQKGMFVADGPGRGGRQAGGQNVRDHGQVSLGGHLPPSGAGCVCPALSWELQEPRAGDTRVCVSWLTTYWCVFCPPCLAGLACCFPRPACVPGTLQAPRVAFVSVHNTPHIADEEREAQRGAEAYPSLHSSDKARTVSGALATVPCCLVEGLTGCPRGPAVPRCSPRRVTSPLKASWVGRN